MRWGKEVDKGITYKQIRVLIGGDGRCSCIIFGHVNL